MFQKHAKPRAQEDLSRVGGNCFHHVAVYTNLLMGQLTHSHYAERGPGSLPAIYDVVTPMNVLIGLVGAVSGYFVIELFRKYL
jgi:hypothetical protein